MHTGPAMTDDAATLPDPDGKSADMTKLVQVFILMARPTDSR